MTRKSRPGRVIHFPKFNKKNVGRATVGALLLSAFLLGRQASHGEHSTTTRGTASPGAGAPGSHQSAGRFHIPDAAYPKLQAAEMHAASRIMQGHGAAYAMSLGNLGLSHTTAEGAQASDFRSQADRVNHDASLVRQALVVCSEILGSSDAQTARGPAANLALAAEVSAIFEPPSGSKGDELDRANRAYIDCGAAITSLAAHHPTTSLLFLTSAHS